MKLKGQTGIEALVVIGVVVGIAALIFFAIAQRDIENQRINHILTAQQEADKLAETVNRGVIVGDGFERNITVRQRIDGFNITQFKIYNQSRVVAVEWRGINNRTYRVTTPLLTNNINSYTITQSNITVRNVNNSITITQ